MKIHSAALPDKARPVLLLAADVSRDTLHLFTRFDSGVREVTVEDVVPNRTAPVEEALIRIQALAQEHGLAGVRVLCEASGGYERLYLTVAQRLGIETALVSPEQSKSLTKLVRLDTGKTDKKDAEAVHLAGTMGKTQRHRGLPEPYVLLRHLTAFHDDEVRTTSAIRTRLLGTLITALPRLRSPNSVHLLQDRPRAAARATAVPVPHHAPRADPAAGDAAPPRARRQDRHRRAPLRSS